MAWTLFVLSSLYICERDIVARHCGQVMNDRWRMEVHSNNLQADPSRSLPRGRKFIIQLSEDFFFYYFIFYFYLERYLLWLSIYFPIYKSHSESAFDKCQRRSSAAHLYMSGAKVQWQIKQNLRITTGLILFCFFFTKTKNLLI